MAHIQQQILEAVHATLLAGATAAATRVYLDRLDPVPASDLPAITVAESSEGDVITEETIHGLQRRELRIEVTCLVAAVSTYAADARALGLEVEKLLSAAIVPPAIAALVNNRISIVSSAPQLDGNAELPLAARLQTWLFTYFCNPATPDLAIP